MAATPATVKSYLASIPGDRRAAIAKVRETIVANLPKGYQEVPTPHMLTYSVPLSLCPDTYNQEPLLYAALAAQKNYMTVHLMPLYGDAKAAQWFRDQFTARGMKLDMGKACVRFNSIDELPLEVIGEIVAKYPVDLWVNVYRQSRTKARTSPARRAGRGTRAAAKSARRRPARRS